MKKYILLFILTLFLANIYAKDFQTYIYFKNDSLQLKLDLFLPTVEESRAVPLVIFLHGGGFSIGNRTEGYSLARYLAKNGIACATIDYTLYMKNRDFGCNGKVSEQIKALRIAASDMWMATSFLIKRAIEYHIDTTKFFIAGSSAGAETVLNAPFWNYRKMNLLPNALSDSFCYAGIIAGSGACMDLNLITDKNIIPTMMFHGTADSLVPYDVGAHHFCDPSASGWWMLFGSKSVFQHIVALNATVELITFQDGTHYYAGYFFQHEQDVILKFLHKVLRREKFQCHYLREGSENR
jgi:poly(3-hydroxybutyrate) depolymerase